MHRTPPDVRRQTPPRLRRPLRRPSPGEGLGSFFCLMFFSAMLVGSFTFGGALLGPSLVVTGGHTIRYRENPPLYVGLLLVDLTGIALSLLSMWRSHGPRSRK